MSCLAYTCNINYLLETTYCKLPIANYLLQTTYWKLPIGSYITFVVYWRFCGKDYYPFDSLDIEKYVVTDDYTPMWKVRDCEQTAAFLPIQEHFYSQTC